MIKVILMKRPGEKLDITNLVGDISWSGDENTFPRKLELQLNNTKNIKNGVRLIGYDVGNPIFFYEDGKELFRGFIFTRTLASDGKESVIAYDELIYFTKISDTILVRNKQASDVLVSMMKKYGAPVGNIKPTGFKIKKLLLDNKTISDMATDMFEETKKSNGKSFKLRALNGKVDLIERASAAVKTISIDNVISASNEFSLEEVRTQVKVTKGTLDPPETTVKKTTTTKKPGPKPKPKKDNSAFVTYVVKDKNAIERFGVMQHLESMDDTSTLAQMKAKADSLLKELKVPVTTVSIEFIGNSSCITGNIIEVKDNLSNLSGRYYISSDSHSWSGGIHKMSLQLSKRLI